MQIQEEFEERSEILLKEFLKVGLYPGLYVLFDNLILENVTAPRLIFPLSSDVYVILFK